MDTLPINTLTSAVGYVDATIQQHEHMLLQHAAYILTQTQHLTIIIVTASLVMYCNYKRA